MSDATPGRRRAWMAALVAGALAVGGWSTPAWAVETSRGSFSLSMRKRGVRMRASGPLKLRLNRDAGTFTCICYGTGTASGTFRVGPGKNAQISSRSKVKAIRCSGTIRGTRLLGKMRFTHRGTTTVVARVPVGNGTTTVRKTMTMNKPFSATIKGTVGADGSGSGVIVDDEHELWRWQVSGAGAGAAPPPRLPPPEAQPPRAPREKVTPPTPRQAKRGAGRTPEQRRRDEARRRDRARQKAQRERARQEKAQRESAQQEKTQRERAQQEKTQRAQVRRERLARNKRQQEQVKREVAKLDKALAPAKRRREFNKALDEDANTLADAAKGKLDEAKQAVVDKAVDKGWGWLKGKSKTARRLERAGKRAAGSKVGKALGKAAGIAGKVKEKFDKAKEIVDEIKQVKKTIDGINKDIKSGAISKKRGRVLKGGTLLGKAISKVVGWLPVFGSTASKVTDKTFGAAMRAGNKIAKHYTKTDCCINDPLADCCL